MSLLLQYLQGFTTQLVLFLILTDHILFLASDIMNYGTRLGDFLHFCLWSPRCWYLKWFTIFLASQQHLGYSLQHHQITSPWLLPIGRLIRVFLNFRLAWVWLLMSLSVHSNSIITQGLHLLIPFPLNKILGEEWFLFQKCVRYLPRFMAVWTVPCPNGLVTQLVF